MSNVSGEIRENVLYISLTGRVDSSNASEVEKEIFALLPAKAHSGVVVDMDGLEYISSAGLRVILHLRKDEPTLKIVNASSEVYEILDMTGFTEMIPVEKAYRRISVEGSEVIGQGANGKVYRIDPDTIVKEYFNADALPDIQRERELARRAFVLGVPTAIPYDVVRVGDGYGSMFELLNAKPLAQLIREEPENLDRYVEMNVDLLKKIHSTVVRPEDMPDMRDVAIGWAEFMLDYLPADKGAKLVELMKAVPVDHHMMHGDYHVKNVMLQNGEALLIDMDTLCQGHPVFELGSMYNAYVGFTEHENNKFNNFLGIPEKTAKAIWKQSLALYLGTDDAEKVADVERKAMLVGYTRLARRLIRRHGLENDHDRKLIETYIGHICELLDVVDQLVF